MKNFGTDWQTAARMTFPPFSLRSDVDVLYRGEKVVALEPNAVRVLRFLIENRERVVGKQELLDTVWRDVFTTEDVLKKAVSQIRRTLKDDLRQPKYIETHHRRGYRFIADIARTPDAAETPTKLLETENHRSPLETESLYTPPETAERAAEKTFEILDADFNQFVGRETEIELLRGEFRRALNGEAQPILIVGEPGIGKTQLSARFADWAHGAHDAVSLRARFYDYEAARISASDLFIGLLRELLIKINHKTGGGDAAGKNSDLKNLAERAGIELPDEIFRFGDKTRSERRDASQIIAPLAECFVRISRASPLVLIFDDLQWADDLSRRVIGYLMRAGAEGKLLILALARGEDCEDAASDFAVWLGAQAAFRSFSTVRLRPLSADDFSRLLERAFGGKLDAGTIPYRELDLIYKTTGGNPYFLIEILRMLLAENVIEKSGDRDGIRWTWRGLSDVPLPESIRMAARGKLIRLSRAAKDYVEAAAVLGDAFAVETLHEMFAGGKSTDENDLEDCLREAVASQVLTEQNVSGADDCQFYHTTLRRAVYADLSPRRRKRLHLRAARAITTVYAGAVERVAAALGVHYEAAGEMRPCFEFALAAAASAGKQFDWKEAADCAARADRAARRLDEDEQTRLSDENRLRLLLATGEAIMSTGRREEAEKTLEKAALLARSLGDTRSLAAARSVQGHARVLLGRYRDALDCSNEALRLSEQLKDDEGIADALLQIGSVQYTLGEFDAASGTLQKVLDGENSGEYRRAVALGKIGWVRALQGRYDAGKILLERALAFHKTTGDARQRIVLRLCLNWCEYGLGNYESAIGHAREAGRLAHQNLGESFSEAVACVRVGKARQAQGLYREAETILTETLARIKDAGSIHCEAEARWFLGRAKLALNQTDEAARMFDESLTAIREIGDREDEFHLLIDVSELQMRRQNYAAALESAQTAHDIARELEIRDGAGAALVAQANALLKLGKTFEAQRAVEAALELLAATESGETWKGFLALAEILQAEIAANGKTASLKSRKTSEKSADASEFETALRRAVALLSEIHAQFDSSDAARSNLFLKSHQKPARLLQKLLEDTDRRAEAAEIRRFWLLD